jgi:hypothetical protein
MQDTVKPFSELPASADLLSGSWAWGFSDGKGFFEHVGEDLSSTRFNMPLAVAQAIEIYAEHRVRDAKNAMRTALGLPLL